MKLTRSQIKFWFISKSVDDQHNVMYIDLRGRRTKTGKRLYLRKKEHMRALTNAATLVSALAVHAMVKQHNITWREDPGLQPSFPPMLYGTSFPRPVPISEIGLLCITP